MTFRINWCILLFFISFAGLEAQIVFRGTVLDETTKQPISNAALGLVSGGVGETTDAAGRFNYRKYHQVLDPSSEMRISAAGYQELLLKATDVRALMNKTTTIFLSKDQTSAKRDFTSFKRIALYWDASSSLKNRNTDKDLAFLKAFVAPLQSLSLEATVFNDQIVKTQNFEIIDGDIAALATYLTQSSYDGTTNYDLIAPEAVDAVLVFSDGNPVFGKAQINAQTPVYTVSSTAKVNHNKLRQWSAFHRAQYVPLAVFTPQEAMRAIENNTDLDYDTMATAVRMTKGRISSPAGSVQGAIIMIKGSLETYTSKADGSFEVPATDGDILQVRYLGMYPKEMLIQGDAPMQIEMIPQDQMLDEVVISGETKKEDDEEINTGFGKTSRKKVGFNINEITSEQISPGALYLSDIIRGQFAGVQVNGFGNDATFLIRGVSSINNQRPPIWVVDGAVYTSVPTFIDPQNVATVSILKSANAAVRYGTIATGGAFVVRTKAANPEYVKKLQAENTALVKGNDYDETENLKSIDGQETKASYITQLERLDSANKQFALYQKMAPNYATSVEFFADMALHFQAVDPELAEKVRLDLAEICGTNVYALRILAYLYDMAESFEKAAQVYERILELSPREAQSYRDLAYGYQASGAYNKALELYINMLGEQIKGIDFSAMENIIGNELRHLVVRHKSQIQYERLPNEWLNTDYKLDVRMLVEYSDNTVPFEFQFVNPNKKFFNWKHTLYDNKDRLQTEQKAGVQMEEFIIDQAPHGLWQINVQYLDEGEQFVIPPFLKFTLYRDYGTRNERREVRLIKLTQQSDKVILGKILI